MKNSVKIQVLTAILISVFFAASARPASYEEQTKVKRNVWFGLRAGSDFASPTTDYDEIMNQLNSNMQIGAFVKLGKKKKFSFNPSYMAIFWSRII